ncbi:hypothetical protein BGZ99_007915 [Dissophora globulifera]|uniref:Secreted protein n=1 Tax=Dissophora globulifera TaxID=979702 RepID=A0A9P6RAS5_9FUNG|nr:hypothetical protein BGZ99_007915 [Dissophora globulifera]
MHAMFAKSSKFIAPLVVALIACMAVDANLWCVCNGGHENLLSSSNTCTYSGGKYYGDQPGGNCLIWADDQHGNPDWFGDNCANGAKGSPYCWQA